RALLAGVGVTAFAFSADGGTLATGHEDGSIALWNAMTGKLRKTVRGPSPGGGSVKCLALSPQGPQLAAAYIDKSIELWNHETDTLVATFKGQEQAWSLIFAPTGPLLGAVEPNGAVQMWDTSALKEGARLRMERAPNANVVRRFERIVAFSPDARVLATGLDNKLTLWDTATGLERLTLWVSENQIDGVAFAPDGKTLAAASQWQVRLWYAAGADEVAAASK
ncbi:MAG TPA: hypothetical protein VGX76_23535, partial [Pirellulales bacterium]|nr:hypothetical protein [Pirellulales bacterium]